ncbi:MAG: hypothetical protein K5917_08165 [Clostridiales bacterium]|nr:hypothetical protein [Clostridiales bacterium]
MKRQIKKIQKLSVAVFMIILIFLISNITVLAYEHDPTLNPRAMEDIVVNPDAVYGFSPNPQSKRLGLYADAIDWTDPEQVAQAREQRAAYHAKNQELYDIIDEGLKNGDSTETIARKVSRRRNELRLEAYKDDPEGLAIVKQSNLDTYGDEFGPSADSLYQKYGSWQTVIEKACSSNAGMDACLGFYDELYYTYGLEEPAVTIGTSAKNQQSVPETSDNEIVFVISFMAFALIVLTAKRKTDYSFSNN